MGALKPPFKEPGIFGRIIVALLVVPGLVALVLVPATMIIGLYAFGTGDDLAEEYSQTWSATMDYVKANHIEATTAIATNLDLAGAVRRGDASRVENDETLDNALFQADPDLLLIIDPDGALIFGTIGEITSSGNPIEFTAERDSRLESELYRVSQGVAPQRSQTHVVGVLNSTPYLLTVALFRDAGGRSLNAGFIVMGTRLDSIMQMSLIDAGSDSAKIFFQEPRQQFDAIIQVPTMDPDQTYFVGYTRNRYHLPTDPEEILESSVWRARFLFIGLCIFALLAFSFALLLYLPIMLVRFRRAYRRRALSAVTPERPTPAAPPIDEKLVSAVQRTLMPGADYEQSTLKIAAYYEPRPLPGGDLYDVVQLGTTCTAVLVADVPGSGATAALLATLVKQSFQRHARADRDAGQILSAMNQDLVRQLEGGRYLTAYCVVLDHATCAGSFCSAGHRPALLYAANTPISELSTGDGVMGIDREASYKGQHFELPPGTRLCLMTDGIVEQRDADGSAFEENGLHDFLRARRDRPAAALRDALLATLSKFRGEAPLSEDVVFVVCEFAEVAQEKRQPPVKEPANEKQPDHSSQPKTDENDSPTLAARLYAESRYKESASMYQRLLGREPNNDAIVFNLAVVHHRLGEDEIAARYVQRYLKNYPQSERAKSLAALIRGAR